jgi:phosphate transport system substrate-binding protein
MPLFVVLLIIAALIFVSLLKDNVISRICKSLLCAIPLFIAWVIAMIIYPQYWALTCFAAASISFLCLLFIWKLFSIKVRRTIAASIGGALVIMIFSFVGYNAYYDSILEVRTEPEGGWYVSDVNLMFYEPFRENTRAVSLDGSSALKLHDNLPRLDGATALYPLYSAFARAVYPEADYSAYAWNDNSIVVCSRTSRAFSNLIEGKADLIFLMGVSEEQHEQARELGLELKITPIGREAFVFFVNHRNSIVNLTVSDIRGIYSGGITNWREVGGRNRAIRAYQRPETSGSQVMLKEIMGGTPIAAAPERNIHDSMMGMYRVVADYRNYRNSLGYSFRYYISDMIAEGQIKFLMIDSIAPTVENIASGAYPFAHDFYAVSIVREHETERTRNVEKLIEWILSPQGQTLVEKTGYVPIT